MIIFYFNNTVITNWMVFSADTEFSKVFSEEPNSVNKARKNFSLAFQFSKYTQKTPDTKYNYAIFLRETGRIRESKTYFKDILNTAKPFNILGFYELVMIDAYDKINETVMRRMKALLKRNNTSRMLKTYFI